MTGADISPWPDPHLARRAGLPVREEEYSRCLDPAKHRILAARAEAWAQVLVARAGPSAGDRGRRCPDLADRPAGHHPPATVLRPHRPGAQPCCWPAPPLTGRSATMINPADALLRARRRPVTCRSGRDDPRLRLRRLRPGSRPARAAGRGGPLDSRRPTRSRSPRTAAGAHFHASSGWASTSPPCPPTHRRPWARTDSATDGPDARAGGLRMRAGVEVTVPSTPSNPRQGSAVCTAAPCCPVRARAPPVGRAPALEWAHALDEDAEEPGPRAVLSRTTVDASPPRPEGRPRELPGTRHRGVGMMIAGYLLYSRSPRRCTARRRFRTPAHELQTGRLRPHQQVRAAGPSLHFVAALADRRPAVAVIWGWAPPSFWVTSACVLLQACTTSAPCGPRPQPRPVHRHARREVHRPPRQSAVPRGDLPAAVYGQHGLRRGDLGAAGLHPVGRDPHLGRSWSRCWGARSTA